MVQHRFVNKGFVALISVLIVSAVGVVISVSLLLLGLGSSRTGFALERSNQVKALVNACAEEALQKIKSSPSFSGSGNISLGGGTCSYTVTNLGGQNREITSSGSRDSVTRKVKITIDKINPKINITSWQEVADF